MIEWCYVLSGFVFGLLIGLPLYPRLCMWKNREALAKLAHEQWSGWMEHFFENCDFNPTNASYYVPSLYAANLYDLIHSSYEQLPEEAKEKDRAEADRMLKIIFGD